jgi:hypothetical protein
MIKTVLGICLSNCSSGVEVEGGITPWRRSTASHASGYCLLQASNSAIIPSGGTPCRTLARYSHSPGIERFESDHRNIRGLRGNRAICCNAVCSLTTHGERGIGIG